MSDSVEKQVSDQLDAALNNDIKAEGEEREIRDRLYRVQQQRVGYQKEAKRLRYALLALAGVHNKTDAGVEEDNEKRRTHLRDPGRSGA